jgi:hypothetical protein
MLGSRMGSLHERWDLRFALNRMLKSIRAFNQKKRLFQLKAEIVIDVPDDWPTIKSMAGMMAENVVYRDMCFL